jgi:tetratricopeptide (TPR) repeat protein
VGLDKAARTRDAGALGAVLRQMRQGRELTLAAVARQAACSESLVRSVETGERKIHSWLANRLDQIYGTGGAISAMCAARVEKGDKEPERSGPVDDVIVIRLPQGGVTVPVSRRELLAAFGLGTVSGPLLETLNHGLGAMRPTTETLTELQRAYDGFLTASRFSTSHELKDAIVAQVGVIDALRARAPSREMRRDLTMLMARHAEAVSWLYEESFDVHSALYWIDRAAFWAQTIDWQDMVAFTLYRRSLLAIDHANDGRQAIELAEQALRIPNTLPSVKGAALDRVSRGYALLGDRDASARAMDRAIPYLSQAVDDPNNPALDAQAVITDDSLAIRQSESWLMLGQGETPIAVLEPRLNDMRASYQRYYNHSTAMLAMAYANSGEPESACKIAAGTLDALEHIPSLSAWRALQRTAVVLGKRWPARSDVKDVRVRVDSTK